MAKPEPHLTCEMFCGWHTLSCDLQCPSEDLDVLRANPLSSSNRPYNHLFNSSEPTVN